VKRLLAPSLNPAGLGAAIAAIYAAVVMIVHAAHHQGVIDPQVLVAALGAAAFLWTRMQVTPVKDPKDGNGQPLIPVSAVATLKPPVPLAPEAPSNVTVVPPLEPPPGTTPSPGM
jgi:hypothetical protein